MKTSLAIALLIGAWTLIYTGFKEPSGNVLVELRAALNPSGKSKR